MTTVSANIYAPHPLPSTATLLDTIERMPPVNKLRAAAHAGRSQATPRPAWFSEGWEGAGFSPTAVLVELSALALLVVAALIA